jgi:hypothetical protein
MAVNTVSLTKLPKLTIGKSDVIFQIKTDAGKVGNLRISKGSIYWIPSSGRYGYKLSWTDFNELMVKKGTPRQYKF